MSSANVLILARLFFRCFVRTALSAGFLRSRLVRVALGVGILLGILILTAVGSMALREMIPGRRELVFVLQVSTVAVVFWTFIVFVFVKVLFMKSDSLVRYTAVLPVSHRERSAALALFEFGMVVGAIGGLFLPLALASLLRLGPEVLPGLATAVAMTTVAAYLVLALVHNTMIRAAEAFGLRRSVYAITLSVMVAATFWYNSLSPGLLQSMSRDYLGGAMGFYGVNAFPFLDEKLGLIAATLIFVGISGLLLSLVLVSSPGTFPLRRRYVKVPVPFPTFPLWATTAAIVRRSEWWIAVVVASFCMAMLWMNGRPEFVFAPVALLSQGIYIYAATDRLRFMPGYSRTALSEVWNMILGQLLVTAAYMLPAAVLVVWRPEAVQDLLLAAVSVASGSVLTTLIAIVFVAENDSPLVVFSGYAICLAVFVSLVAMVGLLQIPTTWLWVGAGCANVLAVVYSVVGLKHITRRKRYEAAIPST